MGCHFCHEELFAILLVVPFMRAATIWIRTRWHRLFGQPRCEHDEHTCHQHVDMTFTGPPGISIQPGDFVIAPDNRPFRIAEVVSIGSDGEEVVQAVEVKARQS